jgi:hypothetical protein
MSGCDVRVNEQTMSRADVYGQTKHAVTYLPIATAPGVLTSSQGPIIGIFRQ